MPSPRWAAITEELRPSVAIRSLVSGGLLFVLELGTIASFAALVYAQASPSELPQAIGLLIAGNAILVTVVGLFSAYRGSIALGQHVPAAVLGLASMSIAAMTAGATFPTIVTMVALTTFFGGLVFVVLGTLKLGNLVRFLPYPVMGGFLAGTGYLLVIGGIGIVATGSDVALWDRAALIRWLPALGMGAALFLVTRRTNNALWLPAIIVVATGLFFGLAALLGQSLSQLAADGWLVADAATSAGGMNTGSLWSFPLSTAMLAQVDWAAIWPQIPLLAPMVLISAIAMLLNTSGLELIIKRDLDLNHELVVAGAGNMLSAFGGGIVGYHAIGTSSLNHAVTPNRRLPSLVLVVLLVATITVGASLVGYIPRIVLSGLVIFLGLQRLADWVYDAWFKFQHIDFLIIVLILAIIAWQGFLVGVAVGIVAALVMFVFSYSRTDVVRHALSGINYRSRVTRSPASVAALTDLCLQIFILRLQGFIFFGTANSLLETVRRHMQSALTRYVVFDFTHVNGLDSTALLSFEKMRQLATEEGVTLVLAGLSPVLREQIVRGGYTEAGDTVRFFTTLDSAVGWCEDQLLASLENALPALDTLADQLEYLLPGGSTDRLIPYLTPLSTAAGDILIRQGDAPDYMYFIESGQVTAQLEHDSQPPTRLETMQGGRVVGELGFYLNTPRTAAVVVDEPGVVYRLSREDLERLWLEDPVAADALQQVIIRLISERLVQLTRAFQVMQE